MKKSSDGLGAQTESKEREKKAEGVWELPVPLLPPRWEPQHPLHQNGLNPLKPGAEIKPPYLLLSWVSWL